MTCCVQAMGRSLEERLCKVSRKVYGLAVVIEANLTLKL